MVVNGLQGNCNSICETCRLAHRPTDISSRCSRIYRIKTRLVSRDIKSRFSSRIYQVKAFVENILSQDFYQCVKAGLASEIYQLKTFFKDLSSIFLGTRLLRPVAATGASYGCRVAYLQARGSADSAMLWGKQMPDRRGYVRLCSDPTRPSLSSFSALSDSSDDEGTRGSPGAGPSGA